MGDPVRQMPQLSAQHRSLDVVEQRGIAMVVEIPSLPVFTVETQQSYYPGNGWIISGHCASVAQCSESFKGVEAEAACQTERTGFSIIEARSQSLRSVLDHYQSVVLGDGHEAVHFANASVQMDRNNCFSPRRDSPFKAIYIHVVVWAHIDQDRLGAAMDNCGHGSDKCMGDCDHLVARTDTGG